ncbi:MAG: dTDP-4-dehydrorhamnose reductase [Clostridiales bacterium]|nr:dTDP-4-dehydrorhamnose reductase [Clostridiales bacterium]
MKVLVTGSAGQLGYDVMKRLAALNIEAKGVDYQDFDLTDGEAVMAAVCGYAPDAIIHCAAYTAVDRAEQEPEKCAAVNGMGTLNLVRAALAVNAKLLYVSTDYIFNGEGETPFEVNDPYGAKNVYGLTKAQGEEAVRSLMTRFFIVRIAWVFGQGGNNFVKTMLRLGAERPEVRVVADQYGSPTYTHDLSRLLCDMIQTNKFGVYHATNEGFCSWAEFAAEIMRQADLKCRVTPIPTSQYPTPAKRPANSRLSKSCLDVAGFDRLPPWQDALARYINELKTSELY